MTRPVWRPHQVRNQLETLTTQDRTYATIRNTAPVPTVGLGVASPTLSSLVFHWPTWAGALLAGVSDFQTARWACTIAAATIDVTTFASAFTLVIQKNGAGFLTCVVPTGLPSYSGVKFITNPVSVIPYSDQITVNVTAPGTGNLGVVAHVELTP